MMLQAVCGMFPGFRDIPLGSTKVPSSGFLGLVTSWLSNLQRGISFVFRGICRLHYIMGLKLIPFFYLFAFRMARAHEEAFTNQAGRKRGTPWETPIVSSLVAAMFVEELRLFNQVSSDIRLEVENGMAAPTIGGGGGGVDNAVYFTREQFAVGLRFPIPSLVKQFLHFTRAPPALIHPNVFQILTGCSVLNLFYHLDI